ncbi:hypothetical protein AB0L34_32175 [Micromonospora sp. NPDC052213]|uniref:hypothetical protein n=1 Tax=Micromonospora sp. NPDC052213 TaxID=3155812 RepID=UPI003430FEFF
MLVMTPMHAMTPVPRTNAMTPVPRMHVMTAVPTGRPMPRVVMVTTVVTTRGLGAGCPSTASMPTIGPTASLLAHRNLMPVMPTGDHGIGVSHVFVPHTVHLQPEPYTP